VRLQSLYSEGMKRCLLVMVRGAAPGACGGFCVKLQALLKLGAVEVLAQLTKHGNCRWKANAGHHDRSLSGCAATVYEGLAQTSCLQCLTGDRFPVPEARWGIALYSRSWR
jgi:hypothetical protein